MNNLKDVLIGGFVFKTSMLLSLACLNVKFLYSWIKKNTFFNIVLPVFVDWHDHICSFGNITYSINVYKYTNKRIGRVRSITYSIPECCSN
jgi:hypothetical protein